MSMKCKDCGALGITSNACPDCGGDNLVAEAGGSTNPGTTTVTALPPTMPALPAMPGMPEPGAATGQGPVVATIGLPDGRKLELRDGDSFTVARSDSSEDVTFRLDDDTVSATPIRVFVRDGKVFATGGGSNGFAVDVTTRYKPDQEIEVVHGTLSALKVGKNTRFPIR